MVAKISFAPAYVAAVLITTQDSLCLCLCRSEDQA